MQSKILVKVGLQVNAKLELEIQVKTFSYFNSYSYLLGIPMNGFRKSNQKFSKHRINSCWKSNPKLNKHQCSSQKSTLKIHPGDKSCNPLSVCIKQLDATFSDCLCSHALIGILFSQTIIENFLLNLCIICIFSTTAYICFQQAYSIRSTFESFSSLFDSSMLTEQRVCSFLSNHRLWVGI